MKKFKEKKRKTINYFIRAWKFKTKIDEISLKMD